MMNLKVMRLDEHKRSCANMKVVPNQSFLKQHAALTERVAVADVSDRTQIKLTGDDRKSFLHNMSTNEINTLPVGGGCEAFLTNAQGKILAHVCVFQMPDSIVLETVPDQLEIITHLDRYLIREDVELHHLNPTWGQFLLAGPQAAEYLELSTEGHIPTAPLANRSVMLFDTPVNVRRTTMAGPVGFLIAFDRSEQQMLLDRLMESGAEQAGPEAVEAVRIEAGWPAYGRDIMSDNLPQEVARDGHAISFTKGCYIGQETVARIDALGHVNRYLVDLRCDMPEIPPPGTPLLQDEKPVGLITSAAYSPRLEAPLAMGYVRRGNHSPGTRLMSPLGPVEVVSLPLAD